MDASLRAPGRRWRIGLLVALVGVAAMACGTGQDVADPTTTTSSSSTPDEQPSASSAPTASPDDAATDGSTDGKGEPSASAGPGAPATPSTRADRLSLPQQVGQLFMTGTEASSADTATLDTIRDHHVGNVMLRGRSDAGVQATAQVVDTLRGAVGPASTGRTPLLVATDQEGGLVQVLSGPGFSTIPRATQQADLAPSRLQRDARRWGRQLVDAGVDVNLAPVLDTVPAGNAAANAPIGAFGRQYGSTPAAVTRSGSAFARGMTRAGVLVVPKHFPGLGRVRGNTDTSASVHDTVTTRDDPALRPFAAAVDAGAPLVMMSSAVYDRIDPDHPAAFSRRVVTGMLRGDLGFDGVVISDDMSAAAQVDRWSPGERAVRFLRAGGDLVLAIDPGQMDAMTTAVLREARRDPAFRARVRESANRILRLKASHF